MNNQVKAYPLFPLFVVILIYFTMGFATTVNYQLLPPLQTVYLQEAGSLQNTLATIISVFFFLGYLVNSRTASKWINRSGYKVTLFRGLLFMIFGILTYLVSACIGTYYSEYKLHINQASIPYGYFIFLIGSFMMGTSAAIIQVVVNPYVSAYEVKGITSVQRLQFTTAVNSLGTVIGPFFVAAIMFAGVAVENVKINQIIMPLLYLAVFLAILCLAFRSLTLPDLAHTRMSSGIKAERSIWSFRHFVLGVLAIFFYVGTEVAIGTNINFYAKELLKSGVEINFFGFTDIYIFGLNLGIVALLSSLYWCGFLIGRLASSFISTIPAKTQLMFTTIVSSILIFGAMQAQNVWYLVIIGLFHSSMWSCIFNLSVKGLQQYTSSATGIFMSAVFGGAVISLIQSGLADTLGSWRWTWWITIICELYMLFYALAGYKIRKQDILQPALG